MATHFLAWTDPAPACLTGGSVSVGNFDGVHRGHQKLIAELKKAKAPAVVVTFDPPPVAILNPSALKLPLTTIPQRAELLHTAGADHVVVLKVEASLLALGYDAFFEEVIQKQLHARAVVEGSNFRFGRSREGETRLLAGLCKNAGMIFNEVNVGEDAVSSSRVRVALNAGDVRTARELLARPYAIIGHVIEGAKRGRTIGVPTANLDQVPTLIPATGVYAVKAKIENAIWPAAANIGPNPTFGEDDRKIEVHLIGFHGDLYGHNLEIEFFEKLRVTKPFPNVDALKLQLQKDITDAKRLLEAKS